MLVKRVSDSVYSRPLLLPPPPPTAQGIITELVSQLFDIKHGYFGSVLSNLAKVGLGSGHGMILNVLSFSFY